MVGLIVWDCTGIGIANRFWKYCCMFPRFLLNQVMRFHNTVVVRNVTSPLFPLFPHDATRLANVSDFHSFDFQVDVLVPISLLTEIGDTCTVLPLCEFSRMHSCFHEVLWIVIFIQFTALHRVLFVNFAVDMHATYSVDDLFL